MARAAFLALPVLWGAACAGPTDRAQQAAPAPAPDAAPAAAPVAKAPPPPPPYGPEVKSLRLKRSIVVRLGPDEDAKDIGTVMASTRVAWRRATTGPGCDRWIEIEPRGWICDKYLEPSTSPPQGVVFPVLPEGQLVPGTYGKIAGTAVTVRKTGEIVAGKRKLWTTSSGQKVNARRIVVDRPSTFAGIWLEGRSLPLAWAQSRKNRKLTVAVRAAPDRKAPAIQALAPRTVVDVLETRGDFTRIGSDRWVATADLHIARASEPPDDLRPEEQRWLDVDLDEQVVVAFEGRRPVFATLASTGNKKWPTAAGIYRIWIKIEETNMSGQMGDERPYSVATVPWTMYFARDLAFHAAYWHDRFGQPHSHGCVNLSPRDARTLYEWAGPDVPLGWSMARGYFERPGSLVRVHGAATPATEYRGYAKAVRDARPSARL